MVSCIESDGTTLPESIVDLSTVSLTIDNRGMAKLSLTVLTKNTSSITGSCSIAVGGGKQLCGVIIEDSPKELVGTVYYEHNLTIQGIVT